MLKIQHYLCDDKGPFINDVSHFGARGVNQILTFADRGRGVQSKSVHHLPGCGAAGPCLKGWVNQLQFCFSNCYWYCRTRLCNYSVMFPIVNFATRFHSNLLTQWSLPKVCVWFCTFNNTRSNKVDITKTIKLKMRGNKLIENKMNFQCIQMKYFAWI